MKICSRCKQTKSLNDFYTDPSKQSGLRYECKECGRASKRAHSRTEKGIAYRKSYTQTESAKLAKKRYRASNKGRDTSRAHKKKYVYSEESKEILRATRRRWNKTEIGKSQRAADRKKQIGAGRYRVYHKVLTALRNGSLQKMPCEKCGKEKTQAHHDDYSKPLDIRWLCSKHHSEHHRRQHV